MSVNQNLIECSVCGNKIGSEIALYEGGYHFCCEEHYREWKNNNVNSGLSNEELKEEISGHPSINRRNSINRYSGSKIISNSYNYVDSDAAQEMYNDMHRMGEELRELESYVKKTLKRDNNLKLDETKNIQEDNNTEKSNSQFWNILKKNYVIAIIIFAVFSFIFFK